MAQAAREEQGRLAARLEALEARLASLEGGAKPS
jgi:BMFP domain-containing protein YqiC